MAVVVAVAVEEEVRVEGVMEVRVEEVMEAMAVEMGEQAAAVLPDVVALTLPSCSCSCPSSRATTQPDPFR